MASCPACGADIQHATDETTGENVPLEKWTDPTGPSRYRIVGMNPLTCERVAEASEVNAYPDHRLDCPAHGNGLVGR
jgi:hypothetical protein